MIRLLRMLIRPTATLALWLIAVGFFGMAYQPVAGRPASIDQAAIFMSGFAIASAMSAAIALALGGRKRWALEVVIPTTILLALPVAVAGVLSWLAQLMRWKLPRIDGFYEYNGSVTDAVLGTAQRTLSSGATLGVLAGMIAGVLLLLARRWPGSVGLLVVGLLLTCMFTSFHIEAFGRVADLWLKARLHGVTGPQFSWSIRIELPSALGATSGAFVGAVTATAAVRLTRSPRATTRES